MSNAAVLEIVRTKHHNSMTHCITATVALFKQSLRISQFDFLLSRGEILCHDSRIHLINVSREEGGGKLVRRSWIGPKKRRSLFLHKSTEEMNSLLRSLVIRFSFKNYPTVRYVLFTLILRLRSHFITNFRCLQHRPYLAPVAADIPMQSL